MSATESSTFRMIISSGSAPGGSVLSSSDFVINGFGTYFVGLSTPVEMDSGAMYTMTIIVMPGSAYSGNWYKQNTNIYSNGNAFIGTGSFTPLVNDDMTFMTYAVSGCDPSNKT